MKFNVGDRVAVYKEERRVGVVDQVGDDCGSSRIKVMFSNVDFQWCYQQQCRKLIKKQRRRIWIRESHIPKDDELLSIPVGSYEFSGGEPLAEFIEVRKKK